MNALRRLASLFPLLVLARRNLSRASARSILAVAAIVIGVVAVGGIGIGGEAFKQDQLEAYEGFGGTATVSPVVYADADPTDRTFSEQELDRMRRVTRGAVVLPIVQEYTPTVRTGAGEAIPTARVTGVEDPGAFYDPASGQLPDNWDRTVVVGSRLANEHDIQVGDRVSVRVAGEFDRSFRVVAVLEPQGFTDPLAADQTVFVPLSQFETDAYDEAIVRVDAQSRSIDTVEQQLEAEFNARERRVFVNPVQEQRDQVEQSLETINQFLIGVGGISLLVAAVTIANTMLMSTIEREGEIGVFRAVGYPKTAVVRLLLAEATILGVIGASIGAPLALGIGLVANQLLVGDPLAFTPEGIRYVGLGMAFGVVTALVAGLYPAWKAANKRPVEALD
ncbi:ABC transporter permease [Salinigranum halophilum]|uniref:ABC transporter permease n=1 Tax=Salinigranum halophilum TaxID=2565931 RepID=UPI00115DA606|nr:ABC transporter permease [Salinigranum halophilum]